MENSRISTSFQGLDEEIRLEMANSRVIDSITTIKTTLNDLYNSFQTSDQIHSYAGFSAQTRIGFAELFGKRNEQEDRIVFGLIPEFNRLTTEKREVALKNTVAKLADLTQQMQRTGATLCVILTVKNKVYTVNVGDSTAYLAVLNDDKQCIQFKRLNKILHQPTVSAERERLEKAGKEGFIQHQRLMGLALSRAMGDTDLESFGLIHLPDIYIDEIALPKRGKAYVIVACDGLTEGGCLAENACPGEPSIEELIQLNGGNSPQEIAKTLADQAFTQGSNDNISVLVSEIEPTSTMVKYIGVFDGHGGFECAELLRTHFHATLFNEIKKEL